MRKLTLAACFLLAACASGGEPIPVESPDQVPTAADIAPALSASPADITALTCQPAEPGCHVCNYTVLHHGESGVSTEPRADMVCNITGGWTLQPMSDMGS